MNYIMILLASNIYESMYVQINGMKTIAQSVIGNVTETVHRRKLVCGAHLISAKFPLSSCLRHIMYFARNMAAMWQMYPGLILGAILRRLLT